jgi:hypothetical protein
MPLCGYHVNVRLQKRHFKQRSMVVAKKQRSHECVTVLRRRVHQTTWQGACTTRGVSQDVLH